MNITYIKAYCCLLFMILPLWAQIDTTALSHYPLHNGDFWQYRKFIYDWLEPSWETRYETFIVNGDTVLSDQQTYKVLKVTSRDLSGNVYHSNRYERIDSISGNVFFYQFQFQSYKVYLLDSLYSLVGDTCRSSRYEIHMVSDEIQQTVLDSIKEDTLMGVVRTIKMFSSFDLVGGYMSYSLAKGIGLSKSWYSYDFGNTACELLYAKISGIEYGDSVTSIDDNYEPLAVNEYILTQNYPNPFNNRSRFSVALNQPEYVQLDLYNILGKHQYEVFKGKLPAGIKTFSIDGTNLASGVYIYVLKTGAGNLVKKCLIIK